MPGLWGLPLAERNACIEQVKESWIEAAKRVLVQVQLHDNVEKTLIMRDHEGERKTLIKPRKEVSLEGL